LKVWLIAIVVFLVIVTLAPITGCGGGGTGTSTTTSTTGVNYAYYLVEGTKNGALIDPTNIVQGETIQFDVAGYTSANVRNVLSSSGWTLTPTGSGADITGSGVFTSTAFGGLYSVSATAAGTLRTGSAAVKAPSQAFVTGRIITGMGTTLHGIQIDFYRNGVIVDTSISQGDGTFRAVMPQDADSFEVHKTSIPGGYYKEYLYTGKWYLPQGACRAALPALANGTTVHITDITVPPSSFNGSSLPPPPPPSPC
jgi:hypothetical protein